MRLGNADAQCSGSSCNRSNFEEGTALGNLEFFGDICEESCFVFPPGRDVENPRPLQWFKIWVNRR